MDDDGIVLRAALGLLGMGGTPLRAPAAEAAIIGSAPSAADLDEIATLAVGDLDPPDDIHGSSTYRKRIGAHLVRRTLARALEEARRP